MPFGLQFIIFVSVIIWTKDQKLATHHLQLQVLQIKKLFHSISHYIFVETIESSWLKFEETIRKSENVEEIIDGHYKYLDEVQTNLWLNGKPNVFNQFKKLVDSFLMLNGLNAAMNKLVSQVNEEHESTVLLRKKIVFKEFIEQFKAVKSEISTEAKEFFAICNRNNPNYSFLAGGSVFESSTE